MAKQIQQEQESNMVENKNKVNKKAGLTKKILVSTH